MKAHAPERLRQLNLAPKQFDIFCDEGHTRHRFMVYSGLVLPTRDVQKFNDLMKEWRLEHKVALDSEIGWVEVTDYQLPAYKALIDLYMANRWRDGFMNFKAMVVDQQAPDHVRFTKFNHKVKAELGYYKLYEIFLRRKFGNYAKDSDYSLSVHLDERSTNYPLDELKKFLNLGIRLRQPFLGRGVVDSLDMRLSHKTEALQLADVLMGAIGWHMNEMDKKPGASRAKAELAIYLATNLKIKSGSLKDPLPNFGDPLFDKWMFEFPREQRPVP